MDLVLLIILVRAGYVGTLHGIWVEGLRLIALLGAVGIGAKLTVLMTAQLAMFLSLDITMLEPVCFFVLTLVAALVLRQAAKWLGRRLTQHAVAKWNQAIGGLMGLVSGAVMVGLVAWCLSSIPWAYLQASVHERSGSGTTAVRMIKTTARLLGTWGGGGDPNSPFFT